MSSIAELFCQRDKQVTFEAVWARSGKPLFPPAQMLPMPFPCCYYVHTQRRFGRTEHPLEWILEQCTATIR